VLYLYTRPIRRSDVAPSPEQKPVGA